MIWNFLSYLENISRICVNQNNLDVHCNNILLKW